MAPPVPPSAAIPGEALGCASVQMSSGVIDYLFHSFGNLLSSCAEGALMPCKLCSLSDGSIVYSVLCSGEGLYTPCAVSTVGGLGSLGFSLICSPKQWFILLVRESSALQVAHSHSAVLSGHRCRAGAGLTSWLHAYLVSPEPELSSQPGAHYRLLCSESDLSQRNYLGSISVSLNEGSSPLSLVGSGGLGPVPS